MRRVAVVLVLAGGLAAAPDARGERPALRVDAVAERSAQVRGSLPPLGRMWTVRVAFRAGPVRWRVAPATGRRRVTARLDGLRPATRYAVRLVASRCGGCPQGTVRSRIRRLTTRAPAPVAPPVPVPSRTPPAPAPEPEPPAPPPAAGSAEPAEPAEPAPDAAAPGAAATYRNPVHPGNFPDPTLLRDGDTWYAYGTGERFPVLRSTDLVRWTPAGTALAARPSWALPGDQESHPWAPGVLRTDRPCPGTTSQRCFLLFHVSLSDRVSPTTNCVGVAASPTPAGPFAELGILERDDGERPGGRPAGCGDERGWGNIDPAPFVDEDGRVWLYVSTDWACGDDGCPLRPTISVIPLTADGLRAAGPREPLLAGRAGTWEQAPWAPVVENPWIVRRGDTYHLLFSGGSWQGAYGMGHATAPTPAGPFTRSAGEPWVRGSETVSGPGGGMVVEDAAGDEWLAYHGRSGPDGPRSLRLDRLRWEDERPVLDGPSGDERPAPAAG